MGRVLFVCWCLDVCFLASLCFAFIPALFFYLFSRFCLYLMGYYFIFVLLLKLCPLFRYIVFWYLSTSYFLYLFICRKSPHVYLTVNRLLYTFLILFEHHDLFLFLVTASFAAILSSSLSLVSLSLAAAAASSPRCPHAYVFSLRLPASALYPVLSFIIEIAPWHVWCGVWPGRGYWFDRSQVRSGQVRVGCVRLVMKSRMLRKTV